MALLAALFWGIVFLVGDWPSGKTGVEKEKALTKVIIVVISMHLNY